MQGTGRPPQPGKSIRITLDKTPTPSSGNFYFSNSKFVSINTFLQERLEGYIQITERKKLDIYQFSHQQVHSSE